MIFQAPGYTTHPPQHLLRHMSFSEGLLDENNAIIRKKCYSGPQRTAPSLLIASEIFYKIALSRFSHPSSSPARTWSEIVDGVHLGRLDDQTRPIRVVDSNIVPWKRLDDDIESRLPNFILVDNFSPGRRTAWWTPSTPATAPLTFLWPSLLNHYQNRKLLLTP